MTMQPTPPLDLAAGVAAALDWWRDAGVDCDFLDEPRDWLPKAQAEPGEAPPPPLFTPKPEPEAPPPPRIGGEAAGWPQGLAEFAPWWMAEPSLDSGHVEGRVPPRGAANPALMIIVAQPEPGDAEAGHLLSGPHGKLLAAMLPALGLREEEIYLASALPRAMPAPDWAGLQALGLGEVLAHHIALVAPARVLALGGSILPLLGNELPQKPANLLHINQDGGNLSPAEVPALAAHDLGILLDRPRSKAGFWQNWLKWTAA